MLSVQNVKERILSFVRKNAGCSPIHVASDVVPHAECSLDLPASLEEMVKAGELIELQFATGKSYYSSLLFPQGSVLDISSSDGEAKLSCNGKTIKKFKSSTRLTIVRN